MKPKKGKDKDFEKLDTGINGLSDSDIEGGTYTPPKSHAEFICTHREHSLTNDGYYYHVTSVDELDELDFIGKTVLINDRERLCHSLDIVDGEIVIFVTRESVVT